MNDEKVSNLETRIFVRIGTLEAKLDQIGLEVKHKPSQNYVLTTVVSTLSIILALFWFPFSGFISQGADAISGDIEQLRVDIRSIEQNLGEVRVDVDVLAKLGSLSADQLKLIAKSLELDAVNNAYGINLQEFSGTMEKYLAAKQDNAIFSVIYRYRPRTSFAEATIFVPSDNALRGLNDQVLQELSAAGASLLKEAFWNEHIRDGIFEIGKVSTETNPTPNGNVILLSNAAIISDPMVRGSQSILPVTHFIRATDGLLVFVEGMMPGEWTDAK